MTRFNEQVQGLFALGPEDKSPLQTTLNTMRTKPAGRPEITLAAPEDEGEETALRDFAKTLFAPEKD